MSGQMAYVVTRGEYSSYGIVGVYSTEEKARAAAGDEGTVEYYAVDEADDAYGPWSVRIQKTGKVTGVNRVPTDERSVIYRSGNDAILSIWARTREQAIKAANEWRAALIADGIWSGVEPVNLEVLKLPQEAMP